MTSLRSGLNVAFFAMTAWWAAGPVLIAADSAELTNVGSTLTADEQQFFEKQVRPLLIKHCYSCHSAEARILKGGLYLDSRGGWMKGGDSGAVIVPGEPDKSLLIEAIRYESIEMPPKGKLAASEVTILEQWVRMGAPDPRIEGAP